jgi:hypothetical protein
MTDHAEHEDLGRPHGRCCGACDFLAERIVGVHSGHSEALHGE